MELAAAAMSPLLEKLRELLVGELTLGKRVRKDIKSLYTELAEIHDFLHKMAAAPQDQLDNQVKQVRELSYDMEDAVDAFIVRVMGNQEPARAGLSLKIRVQELFKKTARLLDKSKALHELAGAIEDAQSRSKQLRELRQSYEIRLEKMDLGTVSGNSSGASIDLDPRLTAMYREAAELVGVDGFRNKLIDKLSDGSKKHVQTLSIFGFGGLGKTTLARVVYERVKVQFECGAFVSVSQSPDITRIFKEVLYDLDKKKYADINESVKNARQLIEELREFLQDKRFLIVIDDIWDASTWEFIKTAFPKNYLGSTVITTTRIHDVAKACCPSTDDHNKVYEMKPLSESDSQKLFYMRIFGHRNRCPPELEQVSRDILKKCGGVPLAIISIAIILASHIKTKDQWCIVLNSIGHGLTQGGDMEGMRKILSYSYYDLPSHLKPCLLYLSIFPEDHDIERDRLIYRWVAEGFVQHENNNVNLYEIGESYFNELINRSMVQPVGIYSEGKAQSCRLHDIMLDVIRSLSTKENFVTIWDGQSTFSEQSILSQIKVRRLSLQNSIPEKPGSSTIAMSQVRSFTAFSPSVDSMPSLLQFQVLRVLDLEGCALKKCGDHFKLRHVGNLSHLRYLGLRRTDIHELPVEIGKLQFLQTLDVRGAHGIRELPPTISELRKLLCLHLDCDTKLPKNGLSNLTFLQELTGLRIGHDSANVVKELGNLTGLRVLRMWWEETNLGQDLVQTLGNLRQIKTLDLYVNGGCGDLLRSWVPPRGLCRFLSRGPTSALPTLPAWVRGSSLPYLTFLDVLVGKVWRSNLQALGTLPALRGLRLRATGGIEGRRDDAKQLAVPAGAFPSLQVCAFLHFATMPAMFPPGAMTVVRWLEFSVRTWDFDGASVLRLNNLRVEHLPSLEKIRVELWCRKRRGDVVEMVAEALRREAYKHPNKPTLGIIQKEISHPAEQQGRILRSGSDVDLIS